MYLEAEADVHENVKTLYERYGSETTTSTIIDPRSGGLPLAEGRPVIDEVFRRGTDSGLEYVFHINSNHVITKFDGETATGTSHVYAFSRFEGVHEGRGLLR